MNGFVWVLLAGLLAGFGLIIFISILVFKPDLIKIYSFKSSKKWQRPALIVGSIIFLFLIWDWFKAVFATWFISSDAGEAAKENFGWTAEMIANQLWMVIIIVALSVFLWKNHQKTWNRFVTPVIVALSIIGITLSIVTGQTLVDLKVNGLVRDTSDIRAACEADREELENTPVSESRPIAVCPENGPVVVYMKYGYRPTAPEWNSKFKRDHEQELEVLQVEDFVFMKAIGGGAWKIYPREANRQRGEQTIFEKTGLNHIVLQIKGVKVY